MRVLVDMDGVIVDWGSAYNELLDAFGPAAAGIPRHEEQAGWNINAGRSPTERRIIAQIMNHPGFYRDMTMIEGAADALQDMTVRGHHVVLCTSPWASNPTCASDKLAWVAEHLGFDWTDRVVMTMDKTLVAGDVLIDDKPKITGSLKPSWEHVVFDQPYNRHVRGRRRIRHWDEWAEVLG